MRVFGPRQCDCFVYVYREGALSAVGHDLKLRVSDFEIALDEGAAGKEGEQGGPEGPAAVRADFRAGSLRVVGVLDGGGVNEGRPSPRDRQEIERNIAREVLEADRYPVISFRSRSVARAGQEVRIDGSLELHGVARSLGVEVRQEGDRARARVTLHQPDFRIKPYRAMFGALRVKPDVRVEVSVPLDLGSLP